MRLILLCSLFFVVILFRETTFASPDPIENILAQNEDGSVKGKIDSYIESLMASKKIPGLSLVILKNGKLVKNKSYGYANVELKVAATPKTVYQTASIGKQFLATLVMMLVQDGTLSLKDPINKYIKTAPPQWKKITIQHLLNHTAGLDDYTQHLNLRSDYTDKELIKIAASSPLKFKPGERFEYSNSGYMLLGIIVQRATGRFYADLLEERIFKPLQMLTARINSAEDIIPNRAAGYTLSEEVLKNQFYISPSINRTADGSLCMTVLDLAKWDAALHSEELLKKSNLEKMWQPTLLNNKTETSYGFGWELGHTDGHPFVKHSGGWQGFSGHIVRYLDDKVTVIILSNLQGIFSLGQVANEIAELYRGEPKNE